MDPTSTTTRFQWMSPLFLLAIASLETATPPTIAAMKWHRRVLLVSAPAADDPALREQRRIVAGWKAQGDARDLSVVEVVDETVAGTSDNAATLRRRFRLPVSGFTAILIGKDGGAKLRSGIPVTAASLEATIDAMPMRRAGER